ncbi:ABC transporter ATP-binding protein [Janthinobacterium sp. BJB301]|uniref:ABC transporter ATP-binding protein n=1 Tax=Janthinobacterium lividum TaxID=29581 RepID=A0ABU0XPG2_9BURK|nr:MULTISPECIES: ABC transporter ATP-binding protein [Janthinobacterium]MBR7634727.1 ABC transporter ATP-binding protein [Janthinobacterium lividum]MDQ4624895.1 ABC transporter ATP-binding protein [Janthinobacterium lividum]MDQ4673502.1 ABC transporter ATP-binding protein [Janthinobacterium lividum]MDQ4684232.1 ABC transporter ATP-binding protein [Janthinobacterium lividum]PHV51052.1 ABC transporter ATP-binding protein [Janthinobacterium sp. BJB301]
MNDFVSPSALSPQQQHLSGGLQVQHVSKSFSLKGAPLLVLDDISLTIAPGEFVAIVGASGCGKSTLLRLLAGLDTDYTGLLLHDGVPIRGTDLHRGLVFQDHRLFPWLTVQQNVAVAFSNTRVPLAERASRVAAEIARVGLDGYADAYPHQLSGGMSQRAAIARALVGRPDVLLLDEPLGALDALTRLRLQQELRRLWQDEGITMVMVTHDIDEAVYLADRIVVLDARPGKVRRVQDVPLAHPRQRGSPGFVAIRDGLHADFSDLDDTHAPVAQDVDPSSSWDGNEWARRMAL